MIYPMYALFLLTFAVAVIMFRRRVAAVRSKDVPFKFFRSMSGDVTVPEYAAVPARQFSNLFELPVLFYTVCLASMILKADGLFMVGLAWAFVFCRLIQALINLTYNNIFHRIAAFFAGYVVLIIMWTWLIFTQG